MTAQHVDIGALLKRLRLATVARILADYEVRAVKEGWSHREMLTLLLAGR